MVVESKITISLINQLFGRDLIDGLSRSAGMQDLYGHVKEFIGCAKHANIVTFN